MPFERFSKGTRIHGRFTLWPTFVSNKNDTPVRRQSTRDLCWRARALMVKCGSEGVELLSGNDSSWSRHADLACHIYWHWAIFLIHLGRVGEALDIFDGKIVAELHRSAGYAMDVSDAVSLLVRLEILGHDVGTRWRVVDKFVATTQSSFSYPFTASHYLIHRCHVDPVDQLEDIVSIVADGSGGSCQIVRDCLVGIMSYYLNLDEAALEALFRVRHELKSVGGSNAQRQVFSLITIHAAIRAGRISTARSLISTRTGGAVRERLELASQADSRLPSLPSIQWSTQ